MNISDIQKRIDVLPAKLNAKGKRGPCVDFTLRANEEPRAYVHWDKPKGSTEPDWNFSRGKTVDEVLQALEAFVDGLPSGEQARFKEFMSALGGVIDLGKTNGIEVEFLNPLTETMKRLSKNALTDARVPA